MFLMRPTHLLVALLRVSVPNQIFVLHFSVNYLMKADVHILCFAADLKVAEIEADERLQSSNRVVDHHTDLEHLEASNNILNNNDDASQTAGEVGTFVSYGMFCTRI